ncbi:type III secretion system chaperone [Robbsia andropogonis]|nr:type III secretion system chaperone [Robbsia andropogonis]
MSGHPTVYEHSLHEVEMNFAELLAALGLEARLDLKEAAKTGSCTIQFDESLEVTLEAEGQDDAQTVVQIQATIGNVPVSNRETIFAHLLQIHLFGLATAQSHFGYDPKLERVIFFKTMMLENQTRQEAINALESFVNQCLHWRHFLPNIAEHGNASGHPGLTTQQSV